MNNIFTLPSKLRIAHTYNPNVRSVCWGVFVGVGSVHETAETSGISHLIEHMCFKGTTTRSAFDIARETEDLGTHINAFTSKEMTAYYVQCVDDMVEKSVEILADLVINHTFDPQELKREQQVVAEEIAMNEDAPDDLAADLAAQAFWGEDSLARPILGSRENVLGFTREDLFAYQRRHYVAGNVVISVAGNITEQEVLRLVDKYFTFPEGSADGCGTQAPRQADMCYKQKDVEQCNVIICFDGLQRNHPDRYAMMIMDEVLGGGMSSILFQRVREEQGLAYSVYSFNSAYVGRGSYCVYVGTSPAKLPRALSTVNEIIKEFVKDGITAEQLERGRAQSLSSCVLGTESMMSIMRVQARYLMYNDAAFDMDAEIEGIRQVTQQQVNDLIKHIFAAPPAVGMVAKDYLDCKGYFDGK